MKNEWIYRLFTTIEPIQYAYGVIAMIGGVARYLNGYTAGKHFKFSVFVASAFTAGFSGWMFAQIGLSMRMPQEITFMMAGTGGFMGEQTMKFVMEWLTVKLSTNRDV